LEGKCDRVVDYRLCRGYGHRNAPCNKVKLHNQLIDQALTDNCVNLLIARRTQKRKVTHDDFRHLNAKIANSKGHPLGYGASTFSSKAYGVRESPQGKSKFSGQRFMKDRRAYPAVDHDVPRHAVYGCRQSHLPTIGHAEGQPSRGLLSLLKSELTVLHGALQRNLSKQVRKQIYCATPR
jgi:hypothetical protein